MHMYQHAVCPIYSYYDMDAYWFPHLTGPSLDLELLPNGLTTLGLLKKWLLALQSVSESPQSKENGEHQPRIDAVLEGHNKIRDCNSQIWMV